MQNESDTLKTIFNTNNIPVSIEWLQECINWCKSEVLNRNYTLDQLKNAIHDQWLNLDLRDIETPILPPRLSENKFMILNGNFSLQIMKIVDISKPKYWQLQQIRKENILTRPTGNEVKDTIGSGKRVLQLTLTDGVQYVEAMEYKPIDVLNINLTPGIKIRLSGPITIRRGRLMLEEHNIRILGGEVEGLLITNAAENVLASALKLPLNNTPNTIDMKLLTVEQETENVLTRHNPKENKLVSQISNSKVTNSTNIMNERRNQNNYSIASTIRQDDFPTEEDMEMMEIAENQLRNQNNEKNRKKGTTSSTYERQGHTEEELEMLMEIEDQHIQNNRTSYNKTPDLFEDDFDADQIEHLLEVDKKKENHENKETTEQKKIILNNENQSKKSNSNELILKSVNKNESVNSNLDLSLFKDFVNDDLFADLDLDNLDKQSNAGSSEMDILQLKNKIQEDCLGCYKVKAKFKSIERKVTVQADEFKLEMGIEDASCNLVCKVHSDVVSEWAGLIPSQMMALREHILAGEVEYKKKVQSVLQEIMIKILALDNKMEIQLNGDGSLPVIKKIFY